MAQGYPRKFTSIVIVALIILIQGILYLAGSTWSILVFKCRSIPNTKLGKVMHFIYFRDSGCGEISWSTTNSTSDTTEYYQFDGGEESGDTTELIITTTTRISELLQEEGTGVTPDMPDVTLVASRTYILILAYGIISGLWVLTALIVIGTACCSGAGRKTFHICYIPWIIVVCLGSILDVIATGFHLYDVYHTVSVKKTLEYLDVKNIDEMMTEVKDFSKLFTYPAIILTCISCRLIIFWLINLFGVFLASRHARKILCHNSNLKSSHYEQQVFPSQKDLPYDQREFSSQEPSITYSSSSPSSNNRGKRKTFEPYKVASPAVVYNNKYLCQDDSFPEIRQKTGSSTGKRKSDDFNRYDDMSPIAYRRYQHTSQPGSEHRLSLNSNRQRDFAPPSSAPNYRLSLQNNPSKDKKEKRHAMDNVHITDELRGQLPWSYFSARDDIATPKRALAHTEEHDEDEIMPPVPVPDYTYHFPRKERPSIKSDSKQQHPHSNSSSRVKSVHQSSSPKSRW